MTLFRNVKRPVHGDTRTVRKFAWLPTLLSDETVVWLEHFDAWQQFEDTYAGTGWETLCCERIKQL